MTDTDQTEAKSLAEILVDNNLLSVAQIELAIADQEINDIPLEEILLYRGWMTQEKLYEIAPWLKPGSGIKPPPASKPGFNKQNSRTGSFAKPSQTAIEAAQAKFAASEPANSAAKPQTKPASAEPAKAAADKGSDAESKEAVSEQAKVASGDQTKSAHADRSNEQTSPAVEAHNTNAEAQKSAATDNSAVSKALSKASQVYQKPQLTPPSDDGAEKTGTDGKPPSKPSDIPKEPPQRPAGEPSLIVSPVETDTEQNLKSYKEVLKKILALDKD